MYTFTETVELFPQKGGWYYVRVPASLVDPLRQYEDRGLIAVTAQVGGTRWNTSLLPMGNGSHFIALNKKVMITESISLGNEIMLSFKLRQR